MRDKEFQDLRREIEFYRQQLEKYKAKNQANESVSFSSRSDLTGTFQTIKYLRKQLLKKSRQVDAKEVTFYVLYEASNNFLRKQSNTYDHQKHQVQRQIQAPVRILLTICKMTSKLIYCSKLLNKKLPLSDNWPFCLKGVNMSKKGE